jgi:hypothetical protein
MLKCESEELYGGGAFADGYRMGVRLRVTTTLVHELAVSTAAVLHAGKENGKLI